MLGSGDVAGIGGTYEVLVLARFPVALGGPLHTCGVLRLDERAGDDKGDSASADMALLVRALPLPAPFACRVILGGTTPLFLAAAPRAGLVCPSSELRMLLSV